ncbi:MAG: hypothetical protein LBS77_04810 [Desulfovibrio sp.]|nr:hypothetical protein [Desulfovibrio sp.]
MRTLCIGPYDLRQRVGIIRQLAERGIEFSIVAEQAWRVGRKPLPLTCSVL